MAFAQLTYRESLRDIEACLRSRQNKLFHMGIPVSLKKCGALAWCITFAFVSSSWRKFSLLSTIFSLSSLSITHSLEWLQSGFSFDSPKIITHLTNISQILLKTNAFWLAVYIGIVYLKWSKSQRLNWMKGIRWWSWGDSNSRPLDCQSKLPWPAETPN